MSLAIKGLQVLILSATSLFVITAVAQPRIICHPEQKNCDAKEGQWASAAALVATNRSAVDSIFCGGSIVHSSWILTAAHCVEGEKMEAIEIVLGRTVLSEEDKGERVKIVEILTHPDYDKHPLNPTADVALIKLATPTQQPVLRLIDAFGEVDAIGTMATVIGWGKQSVSNENSYADHLQQTTLPIVSNEECNRAFDGDIKDSMLCAGFQVGRTDACDGDSGGALMVETDFGWQQVGIVSWGEKCALPNYYGVYTRLSAFQDFISDTVCTPEEKPAAPEVMITATDNEITASWEVSPQAQGYQFYYSPYVDSPNDIQFDAIHSFDLGNTTNISATLTSDMAFYVAVRAYQGNCYSHYSNIATVKLN